MKRSFQLQGVGWVGVCRAHRTTNMYCGLCLRTEPQTAEQYGSGIAENEDTASWPSIEATCRYCRAAGLWARVRHNQGDKFAVGGIDGHSWDAPDWEVRQAVDAFIALGEGAINEVLALAHEKAWLRQWTRLPEMLTHAMAAARMQARGDNSFEVDDEDTYSEDSYDSDALAMTDDADNCKELALNDWARVRILNGHWFAPADAWYRNNMPGYTNYVKAEHPVPWSLDEQGNHQASLHHPFSVFVNEDIPPTATLCEQAYRAYARQMKSILLPAMSNIVRKLVIECSAEGVDVAIKASKFTLDDVREQLCSDGVWYNGVDWLRRKANESNDARMEVDKDKSDDDNSSEDSNATSPVLSTSTLQTTPSPEPTKDDVSSTIEPASPIPVHPVLENPTLIHSIPYVPETFAHLPHYSINTLQLVSVFRAPNSFRTD
jgi:hypothetical protein